MLPNCARPKAVEYFLFEQVCKELKGHLDNADCENTKPAFKEYVYGISSGVLGFMKWKHEDWSDDNDSEIEGILQEEHKIFSCLFQGNLSHDER